ncbi:MAG: hypothetical protein IJU28_04815 [Clostridia bacterium]|nr:hypothetical protein [Clostridia bacterium]
MSKKRQVILKRALAILFDVMLLYICLFVAGILRGILSDGYTREAAVRLWAYSPLFVGMYIVALNLAGIYSVTWKYADLRDLLRLFMACFICAWLSLALNALFTIRYPRWVLVFLGAMAFVLLTASRFLWLLLQNLMFADKSEKHVRRALVINADEQGIALIKALPTLEDGARHEAVAFLDDDVDKLYRRISGLPVEGTCADIIKVIKNKHVDEVLFTSPVQRDQGTQFIYLNALAEGCLVSKYVSGALKPLELEEMLDGGRWDNRELSMTYRHNIAIIGTGELARQIAILCSENGAGKVFVLDNNAMQLSMMAREGAWVKLGSPTGEIGIREFLRKARPSYVFYMAGIGDQDIINGNEQAIVRQNIMAPLNVLRYADAARASAFIYVTDTRDEVGSARMFACGEAAVLAWQGEDMSIAAVSISGLMDHGAYLSRMMQRAKAAQKLSCHEGETKAFISCRSAAAALIAIAKSRGRGRFTIKGTLAVDVALLQSAVTRMNNSHAECEVISAAESEEAAALVESGLDYTYRRSEADYPVPESFLSTPPVLPDAAQCAQLFGGMTDV